MDYRPWSFVYIFKTFFPGAQQSGKSFSPAKMDGRFKQWHRKGITSSSSSQVLDKVQKISDTYGSHFFRYLQMKTHFNNEIIITDNSETNLTDALVMYENKDKRKLASRLYPSVQSSRKHSTNEIRQN